MTKKEFELPPVDYLVKSIFETLSRLPLRPRFQFRADTTEPLQSRYRRVERLYNQSWISDDNALADFLDSLIPQSLWEVQQPFAEGFLVLAADLARENEIVFQLPELPRHITTTDEALLTDRLIILEYALSSDEIKDVFVSGVQDIIYGIYTHIPTFLFEENKGTLTVPLFTLLKEPHDFVHSLYLTFLKDLMTTPADLAFKRTREQLTTNLLTVSQLTLDEAEKNPRRIKFPLNSDLPLEQFFKVYLNATPFLKLVTLPVPFSLPRYQRQEHMAIYGGSGAGKTQTLQYLLLDDLKSDDTPALIVIDSQNQMLRKLEKLALFNTKLKDRLVVLDPEDEWAPALNMFHMNERFASYSRNEREMIEAGIIDLYSYIFAATAQELTAKQGTAFSFIVRAILAHSNPSILTLLEIMEDPAPDYARSKFRATIEKLDPIGQEFFKNQFYTTSNRPTKSQVARRLYGILRVPAFLRMFSAAQNKLDMLDILENKKILLVNTSKALLKDASSIFGRYIVALTITAAFERLLRNSRPKPAFLILEEAAEYFDERTEEILEQTRKCGLGLCYATQYLEQMQPSLRAAAAANTAIKLASGVSDRNARELAPDMRTSADFINSMSKSQGKSNWACYVKNLTPGAIQLSIPFGVLEHEPQMSADEHRRLRQVNRERYGANPTQMPAPVATAVPEQPDPPSKW